MAGDLRIDSHKLIYHPQRVAEWLEGKDVFPIYVEVGPAARCNQRCIYCAFDYLEYNGPILDTLVLKGVLMDAAKHGIKSVMFAGEGEPLLHKDIAELVAVAKGSGLDVAITTNGVLFNGAAAENCIGLLSWIRFSLDAATEKTYTKIHRCHPADFGKVLGNITKAVSIKRRCGYGGTIGVQAVLLGENAIEMVALAHLARNMGTDYLIIKPFSKHPSSRCHFDVDYTELLFLEEKLREVETDSFKIIFRTHTMEKLKEERPYKQCLGLPFFAYIDAHGDVYACSAFLGNEDFVYGNIYKNKFSEIWLGEQRRAVLKMVAEMGVDKCREVCRLDEINRYLWELKNPRPHHNFI